MRFYPAPIQPSMPIAIKVILGMVIMVIASWLGVFVFIAVVVISDPHNAGETFGEVGASIVNGFKHTIEE